MGSPGYLLSMVRSSRSMLAALIAGCLTHPPLAWAQQQATLFAGLRPGFALIDTQRDVSLDDVGYQVSAYVGRPLGPDFAGVVEVAVTGMSHHAYVVPCAFPGCSPSTPSNDAGISLAPGLQLYTVAGSRRTAFTLTPGVVWFVSRAPGMRAIAPKLGAQFDMGWLMDDELRVGLSFSAEWWSSTGAMPRWVVPFGVTLGLR